MGIVLKRNASAAGSAENKGDIVARADVIVSADGRPQQVVIPYRPAQPGQFTFTIEIEPNDSSTNPGRNGVQEPTNGAGTGDSANGEATSTSDESALISPPLSRSLRVSDEKIRVLLVDARRCRYEYRFLQNMLGRDSTIELHTLSCRTPTRKSARDEKRKSPVGLSSLSATIPFPIRTIPFGPGRFGLLRCRDFRRREPIAAESGALLNNPWADYVDRPEHGHG